MKRTLLIFIMLVSLQQMKAQITGADTVCLEYRYSYTATIVGAVTYTWTLPTGWYFLSGQGTDSVYINVNTTVGQVCVTGYDAGSNPVGTICKNVYWGGGASLGWDAIATPGPCPWSPSFITIQPNGTGGGPGCGSCNGGTANPNIVLGVYDAPWPSGTYQGQANGIDPFPPLGLPGIYTYYIYQVDITPGVNNAYLVEGGCGAPVTISNSVTIFSNPYVPPPLIQTPDPACVGDTVIVSIWGNPGVYLYWNIDIGSATMISPVYDVQCMLVVTNSQPLQISCNDYQMPCPTGGYYAVNITTCAAPVAAFGSNSTSVCEQDCISFTDQSSGNATSWQWTFTGANTASSTIQHPTNICYNTPGTYDVQLIVCNGQGCDTLLLPNYITVNSNPVIPSIYLSADTLLCNTGYSSYSWYESGNPTIVLSTDSFYVPAATGNYFVVVSNSSGCTSVSGVYTYQASVPVIAIASSDTTFCEKNCLDFFDMSQNNPVTWQWYFPGASPDTSTLQFPLSICYNIYGTYTVYLVACNINGCDSVSFTDFITVYQTPPPPAITVSNDTLYCNVINVTYQWYSTSNPTQVLSTNNYYFTPVAGSFYVVVTDTNGCAVPSNTISVTGINSISYDSFNINYEDDAKSLMIKNNSFAGKLNCSIVNALGQTILNDDYNIRNESLVIPFEQKAGIYYLKIESAGNNFTYKFIIR